MNSLIFFKNIGHFVINYPLEMNTYTLAYEDVIVGRWRRYVNTQVVTYKKRWEIKRHSVPWNLRDSTSRTPTCAAEGALRICFLAKKFVLSMIIRIFSASVPTKPLNDAQMRGAFLYIYIHSQNTLMKRLCTLSWKFQKNPISIKKEQLFSKCWISIASTKNCVCFFSMRLKSRDSYPSCHYEYTY